MTKATASVFAQRLGITQVQAGIIVEAALRSIVSALQNRHEVEIRGFGSFRFRNRAPPRAAIRRPARRWTSRPRSIPYFKMGKELKALLNSVASDEDRAAAPRASSRRAGGPKAHGRSPEPQTFRIGFNPSSPSTATRGQRAPAGLSDQHQPQRRARPHRHRAPGDRRGTADQNQVARQPIALRPQRACAGSVPASEMGSSSA